MNKYALSGREIKRFAKASPHELSEKQLRRLEGAHPDELRRIKDKALDQQPPNEEMASTMGGLIVDKGFDPGRTIVDAINDMPDPYPFSPGASSALKGHLINLTR